MKIAPPLPLAVAIASQFGLAAEDLEVRPLGRGLINDSFLVTANNDRWVLQRLNGQVFPDPEGIMANLARLAAHLARQPRSDLTWPIFRRSANGTTWSRDKDGHLWRMMSFLSGQPLERITTASQAAEVGGLLGQFHRALADLDPAQMQVTLPGFHVTPAYLCQFDSILAAGGMEAEPSLGPDLEDALDFLARRRDGLALLEDAREAGLIPERVIHGDPKLDNLLFDATGQRALALIDLDTVQPGLTLHDLGDCLRSCCNQHGETASPAAIGFDLEVCRPLLAAYATAVKGLLTPTEITLLYPAIRLLPLELGLRFLSDHLQGNRWFRVTASGQNLARALAQFALVAAIERQERQIRKEIASCFGKSPPGQGA